MTTTSIYEHCFCWVVKYFVEINVVLVWIDVVLG